MRDQEAARLVQDIWAELVQAEADRGHPWRTPVLATVESDGRPCGRTVVLRKVAPEKRLLEIFTDTRSPKVGQLIESDRAELVFWNPATGWQLRAACRATVISAGDEVDSVWREIVDTAAAADYLSFSAPGSPLNPSEGRSDGHHLAVVKLAVESMDWLALSEHGHRRARITDDHVAWLVP